MTFGSAFSGIGGLDLGLTRAGMVCKWQIEIDDYCTKVLAKHWPEVKRYGDIRSIDELESVELVAGGFPCQPFSAAGKRLGRSDDRDLWPEMFRIIRLVKPRFVLAENVPGFVSLEQGALLERTCTDLESEGYEVAPPLIFSAASVGAKHKRDRVWIVAHSQCSEWREDNPSRYRLARRDSLSQREEGSSGVGISRQALADAPGSRLPQGQCGESRATWNETRMPEFSRRSDASGAAIQGFPYGTGFAMVGSTEDQEFKRLHSGIRQQWLTEPDLGRVANGVPNRVDRLKGLGNAVVPQVAEWIGRRIMEAAS